MMQYNMTRHKEAKVRDPSVDIATAPEAQALVKLIATEGMG